MLQIPVPTASPVQSPPRELRWMGAPPEQGVHLGGCREGRLDRQVQNAAGVGNDSPSERQTRCGCHSVIRHQQAGKEQPPKWLITMRPIRRLLADLRKFYLPLLYMGHGLPHHWLCLGPNLFRSVSKRALACSSHYTIRGKEGPGVVVQSFNLHTQKAGESP